MLYPNNCYNPKLWFKSLKNRAGSPPAITHKLVPSSSQKMFFQSPTPNWHLFDLGRAEPINHKWLALDTQQLSTLLALSSANFHIPPTKECFGWRTYGLRNIGSKSCALTHQRMHQLLGMWIPWWRCTGLIGLNAIETSESGIHQSSYV